MDMQGLPLEKTRGTRICLGKRCQRLPNGLFLGTTGELGDNSHRDRDSGSGRERGEDVDGVGSVRVRFGVGDVRNRGRL